MTAKIKVGKKTYKKTCKITVKKASKVNVTPVPAKTDAAKATATPANNNNNNGGSTATATPKPTEAPVSVIKTEAGTYTVDESATYNVPLTELNETTFTCDAKRSDGETVKDGTLYNKDGSVTFTSTPVYLTTSTRQPKMMTSLISLIHVVKDSWVMTMVQKTCLLMTTFVLK